MSKTNYNPQYSGKRSSGSKSQSGLLAESKKMKDSSSSKKSVVQLRYEHMLADELEGRGSSQLKPSQNQS